MIFTSGSTGRPKAVAGTQRALANRLHWGRDIAAGVRVAKSALTFIDGSTELLGGLVAGDPVVLADDATATDPHALAELVRDVRRPGADRRPEPPRQLRRGRPGRRVRLGDHVDHQR